MLSMLQLCNLVEALQTELTRLSKIEESLRGFMSDMRVGGFSVCQLGLWVVNMFLFHIRRYFHASISDKKCCLTLWFFVICQLSYVEACR